MRWRRVLRAAILAAVALAFVGALLGIGVTGPIVVPQTRLELDIAPSEERLRADVNHLCTAFGARHAADPQHLIDAAIWIRDQLSASGLETTFQDYELDGEVFRNVIAFRPGATPDAPVVVIGAHYDTVTGTPGADDNASGVAALLELARTLPPTAPRYGQYFVAFSTEEPPHFGTEGMGSYFFAQRLAEDRVDVSLMVSLDMVGYFSEARQSQRMPLKVLHLLYPDQGNFLTVVGNLKNGISIRRVKQGLMAMRELPIHSFRAPTNFQGVDWSDHRSFWNFGFPAVLVTDTSYQRNPHYHGATDTPDTLDYPRLTKVVRSLHGVLWNNGGAPLAPPS